MGEVAFVTGSGKGIGRAASIKFAEKGCNVAVHYNCSESEAQEVAEQIEALGQDALLVRGDVSETKDVNKMVEEIEEHYGRVDILVNNAGSMVERASLSEMSEDIWDRIIATNPKTVFLCSQAILPLRKRQKKGRIVNIFSISARDGGSPNPFAYSTAKGVVSTLTRSMAKELISDGVLVNAVAPGRIDTPFTIDPLLPKKEKRKNNLYLWEEEGTPEEVADAIVFVASPNANYIVGEVVEVNGGLLMD